MSDQQHFRSAFNGFNREDVVHYIEYLNSKHASEISQLNSEIEYLRSHSGNTSTPTWSTNPILEHQVAQFEEKDAAIGNLTAENEALKAALAQKDAELEALRQEYAQLQQQKTAALSRVDEELEIYRRAERVERQARERAELVYHRVNGTLADATVKVEDAAAIIGEMSDRVMGQLSQLQAAVTGSKAALKDAADSMYSLRPAADE